MFFGHDFVADNRDAQMTLTFAARIVAVAAAAVVAVVGDFVLTEVTAPRLNTHSCRRELRCSLHYCRHYFHYYFFADYNSPRLLECRT